MLPSSTTPLIRLEANSPANLISAGTGSSGMIDGGTQPRHRAVTLYTFTRSVASREESIEHMKLFLGKLFFPSPDAGAMNERSMLQVRAAARRVFDSPLPSDQPRLSASVAYSLLAPQPAAANPASSSPVTYTVGVGEMQSYRDPYRDVLDAVACVEVSALADEEDEEDQQREDEGGEPLAEISAIEQSALQISPSDEEDSEQAFSFPIIALPPATPPPPTQPVFAADITPEEVGTSEESKREANQISLEPAEYALPPPSSSTSGASTMHPLFHILRAQSMDGVLPSGEQREACVAYEASLKASHQAVQQRIERAKGTIAALQEQLERERETTTMWSPSYRGLKQATEFVNGHLLPRVLKAEALHSVERQEESTLRAAHSMLLLEVATMRFLLSDVRQLAEEVVTTVQSAAGQQGVEFAGDIAFEDERLARELLRCCAGRERDVQTR